MLQELLAGGCFVSYIHRSKADTSLGLRRIRISLKISNLPTARSAVGTNVRT
jgi:hypothetical protein